VKEDGSSFAPAKMEPPLFWRRALQAAVAGLAASLSFPTPGIVPLAFVAWAPLLVALAGATLAQGVALGFTAGIVFFAVVLRWVPALSIPLWIAGSVYLALWVAAFGAVTAQLWRGPRAAAFAIPAAWVALEWLRGWMFGGFPWAELGTALASEPRLLSLAGVGGVALLSLAIVSCNLAAAAATMRAVKGTRYRYQVPVPGTFFVLAGVAIPAALFVHALWRMPASDDSATTGIDVILVGGETDPRIETTGNVFGRAIQGYVAKTDRAFEAGRADLAIWPETALPHPIEEGGLAIHARALRQRIEQQWRAPLLFGVPVHTGDSGLWNEAQLWSAGDVARYQKRRLVPLGEHEIEMPLLGRLAKILPGPGVAVGQGGAPFVVGGVRLGVLICFEDLFSEDVLDLAAASDALVVLTNDVWLGEVGAAQHLAVAALRAVESGRWIARVANRGQTAILDPHGRMETSTLAPQRLPAAQGRTLYAKAPWLVPALCLAATIAALAASLAVRPSRGSGNT
jgi:apolipoprotein N-acyltransferase